MVGQVQLEVSMTLLAVDRHAVIGLPLRSNKTLMCREHRSQSQKNSLLRDVSRKFLLFSNIGGGLSIKNNSPPRK
jgi:hypothetical protein